MQSQLAQIGVEVRPATAEWSSGVQRIVDTESCDFDGVIMGWSVDYRLDDTDLFHSESRDFPYAFSGISDANVDRLLEELSATVDRSVARPLSDEYQRALNDVHPYTYFYFSRSIHGVTKRLRGVEMDARGDWVNIKDWYLDPASR